MKKKVASALLILCSLGKGLSLNAYDTFTHREIARQSAQPSVSSVDEVLKGHLGLPDGIRERFPGHSQPGLRSVEQLIGDGALFEDVPGTRSLNHFHNPLFQADGTSRGPWNQAGLRFGLQLGQSSVLWQQNTNQNFSSVFIPLPFPPFFLPSFSFGGNWSWQDARQRYLEALTGSTRDGTRLNREQRERALVQTFEAVGRMTHLLQDATVPAHVRNDPHPDISILGIEIPFLGGPDWYEKWVENTRTTNPSLFQGLLNSYNKNIHRPPFSIFTPTRDTQAPVPIARLIDSDKFLGLNFSVLTDRDIGISEYTNGNFLSRDTIFRNFDLPRQSSLDPNFIVEPIGPKFRRYLRKTSEGESIDHFITEGLLHETLKEVLAAPVPAGGWTLDNLNVQKDYAAKLLPRAVGYSAALLDYFFRGRLDVDLFPTGDPSVFELKGTNASQDEPLVDGTLALYTDAPDGTRNSVSSRDPLTVRNVGAGQQISDPTSRRRFEAPPDAERFVAVYRGTLGNEVKDDATNFPGAVIGKVLGGVRAEVIFPDGDKRKLRTVDGVFQLPSTADRLRAVQWGDQDNIFVGNLSSAIDGSDELLNFPDQGILAFKINRPLGSPDVPRVGGTDVVSADILKVVSLPFGLSLGVTVNYSLSIHLREFLLTYQRTVTRVWNGSSYTITQEEVRGPTEAEIVLDQTFQFAQSFPLVLDQAHRPGGSAFTPYVWSVQEVAFDRQGRLLALVKVSLTRPDNNIRKISLRQRNEQCQLVEDPFLPQDIIAPFPEDRDIWALIDVERAQVLGITSSSTSSSSTQSGFSIAFLQQRSIEISIGGPSAGTREICLRTEFSTPQANPIFTTVETATIRLPTEELSQQLTGRFRPDIEPLVSAPPGFATRDFGFPLVYFVDNSTRTNRAIRLIRPFTSLTSPITLSPEARLIRPTTEGSPELLLLFRQRVLFPAVRDLGALLVRWSPDSPSKTSLAIPERLPASGFYIFSSATPQVALIDFEDLELHAVSALVADFGSGTIQLFRNRFLSREYLLLEPRFLYNFNDTRFHTLDPSLQATALPRRLAQAPAIPPPTAAYHLIRLR